MSSLGLSSPRGAVALEIEPHHVLWALASFLLALACLCLPLYWFLGGLGGLLALGLLLRWPSLGLYLTAFTVIVGVANYYKMVDGQFVRYFPCMALTLLTLVCWLPHAVVAKKPLLTGSPFTWILVMVLLWEAIGLLWAPHFQFGVENLLLAAANTALFYIVVMVADTPKRLRILTIFIILGALHASGWLIASKLTEYSWKQVWGTQSGIAFKIYTVRPGGLEGSNQVAGFLMFASLLCAALFTIYRNLWGRILLALTGIYLLGISMLTGSRGALGGLLMAVVGFLFIHPQTRKNFIRRTALLGVVVLICILLLAPGFLDRILVGLGYEGDLFFSTSGKKASTSSANVTMEARLTWWKLGLLAMEKTPERLLTGLGPGGFLHHSRAPETHNFYLAFFYDLGLLGVGMLAALLFIFFRQVKRIGVQADSSPTKKIYYAALLGFVAEILVHGVVAYDFTSPVSRFPYFYLAMVAVCIRLLEREGLLSPDSPKTEGP